MDGKTMVNSNKGQLRGPRCCGYLSNNAEKYNEAVKVGTPCIAVQGAPVANDPPLSKEIGGMYYV